MQDTIGYMCANVITIALITFTWEGKKNCLVNVVWSKVLVPPRKAHRRVRRACRAFHFHARIWKIGVPWFRKPGAQMGKAASAKGLCFGGGKAVDSPASRPPSWKQRRGQNGQYAPCGVKRERRHGSCNLCANAGALPKRTLQAGPK